MVVSDEVVDIIPRGVGGAAGRLVELRQRQRLSPSRRKCPRLSIGGADMDIGQWLNGIGLGQYEALFREHEIDAEVLPDLTEADLENIGVPLGPRKN